LNVQLLLVTCCLERSRYELLESVVDNLQQQLPASLMGSLTVFDNASTVPGVDRLLRPFERRYVASANVGYWSAIDWWLERCFDDAPRYTYVIESDMVHYDMAMLPACVDFLDRNPGIGGMRLHEYSVADKHLYDKDRPTEASRRGLWQSHLNKVTNAIVEHANVEGRFWSTNFLTQLPALNRYATMVDCFGSLARMGSFTELDFQRLYHDRSPNMALLDGGMFNCSMNPHGTEAITGSWTHPSVLAQLGYRTTRVDSIVPRDRYTVTAMG